MHDDALAGMDLNLLRILLAVAEHRQVTSAAARLGLSQSATSHALRRLRDHVGDPLFVRGRDGLVPTARGEALVGSVRLALGAVGQALRTGGEFDPGSAEHSFRVSASDGFDAVILPGLLQTLRQQAPYVNLSVIREVGPMLGTKLASGELDLYYGVLPNRPQFAGLLPDPGMDSLETVTVYTESWACVVRADHPDVGHSLSLRRYATLDHVVYSPTGGGPGVVDRLLGAEGLSRRVSLRVSSFYTAMASVEHSDMIWTAPRTIARALAPAYGVRLISTPTGLTLPKYPTVLVWHQRFSHEPAHQWLRRTIVAVPGRAP